MRRDEHTFTHTGAEIVAATEARASQILDAIDDAPLATLRAEIEAQLAGQIDGDEFALTSFARADGLDRSGADQRVLLCVDSGVWRRYAHERNIIAGKRSEAAALTAAARPYTTQLEKSFEFDADDVAYFGL